MAQAQHVKDGIPRKKHAVPWLSLLYTLSHFHSNSVRSGPIFYHYPDERAHRNVIPEEYSLLVKPGKLENRNIHTINNKNRKLSS